MQSERNKNMHVNITNGQIGARVGQGLAAQQALLRPPHTCTAPSPETPASVAPLMTSSWLERSASGQHRPSRLDEPSTPHCAGQPSTPAYGPVKVYGSP